MRMRLRSAGLAASESDQPDANGVVRDRRCQGRVPARCPDRVLLRRRESRDQTSTRTC